MATTEEKLEYYVACEHLSGVISMHHDERLESIIPSEQVDFYIPIANWLRGEINALLNTASNSQNTKQDGYVRFQKQLYAAAHKLSDEMCWISEDNFLYFIFCQFLRGTLEAFEQIASDFGISPYYTDEDRPDFKPFLEYLEKKTPSDSAAKVKVEVLGKELVELWRQEIDKAAAGYSTE